MHPFRLCSRCQHHKPETDFYLLKSGYYHPYCKECNATRSRSYYRNNNDYRTRKLAKAKEKRNQESR